eukprot:6208439-Pleurochrysis_carterae.AAC.6
MQLYSGACKYLADAGLTNASYVWIPVCRFLAAAPLLLSRFPCLFVARGIATMRSFGYVDAATRTTFWLAGVQVSVTLRLFLQPQQQLRQGLEHSTFTVDWMCVAAYASLMHASFSLIHACVPSHMLLIAYGRFRSRTQAFAPSRTLFLSYTRPRSLTHGFAPSHTVSLRNTPFCSLERLSLSHSLTRTPSLHFTRRRYLPHALARDQRLTHPRFLHTLRLSVPHTRPYAPALSNTSGPSSHVCACALASAHAPDREVARA